MNRRSGRRGGRRGTSPELWTPKTLGPLAWYDVHLAGAAANTVTNQMGGTAATLGSTAGADANDPMWLPWTGSDYVYLPGVSGNFVSTPDANALDVTGDLEIVVRVALDSWTPANGNILFAKQQTGTTRSIIALVDAVGTMRLQLSANGSAVVQVPSSVATGFAAGTVAWLKYTWRQSDGRVQFFTALDQATEPSSWTQLGTDQTIAIASIFSSTSQIEIGSRAGGSGVDLAIGKFYAAKLRNGIGGAVVADFDASRFSAGSAVTYVDTIGTNAGTWTINRSTAGRKASSVKGRGLLLLGTDDFWTAPAVAIPSLGTVTPGTVLVVGRAWPTPLNNGRWLDTRGSATETVAGVGIRQNGTADSLVGTIGDGTNTAATAAVGYTAGQIVVASLVVDTTTIKLRVNGTESATTARPAGSATGTTPVVGSATTAAASPFEGGLFAVATYNRVLVSSELATVESFYQAGT